MKRSFKLTVIVAVCALPLAAALAANGQQNPKQSQSQKQSQKQKQSKSIQEKKIVQVSPQEVAAALKQAGYHPPQTGGSMIAVPVDRHNVIGAVPKLIKNPYAGNHQALMRGKKLYRALNCEVCHGLEGGGGQGELLENGVWRYGKNPADVYLSIAHGRPKGMPAWGNALTPQDIWYLVAYVKTLPSSKPPFPPPAPATLQNKARQAPVIRTFGKRLPKKSPGSGQ